MDVVAGSRKAKEPELLPTSLTETTWPVENPQMRALGKWIEFGRKLRSAGDEEIVALIGSVVMYLEDELNNNEPLASPYYTYNNYTEYVRGYVKTILKAARAELRKRNSERLG